ncbi:WRKY transcription factor 44 [Gastrolobium bilobum]|uniref:WRKY transcription factor 44 n=1 Tax=Gastrolobium bilobum TaxID=150636 RepID=UPI002AAF7892|nr:WRKY transcription factor 44 [Gastrolobium bilobum]
MDIKEAERVVVAKPVASRPTCSTFRSFSELLAGAINASPPIASSQTTVSAIRPKTVRFKPAGNRPPSGFDSSQAEIFGAALSNSSDKSPNLDTNQSLIYKPMAKLVSKTTVSLLANMGNCSTSQQQPRQSMQANLQHPDHEKFRIYMNSNLHQSLTPHAETNQTTEPCKMVQQNLEEDQKALTSTINGDRPSYDGYNWRKYGQKQVKGSEYPRSYYKCTHPNCPVKKKVERSFDGQIAEIVYKGEHNHSKPQLPKRNSGGTQGSGMMSDGMVQDIWSNSHSERNECNEGRIENQNNTRLSENSAYDVKAPQANASVLIGAINAGGESPENSCGLSGECEEGSKGFEAEEHEHKSKRRKNENKSNEAAVSEEGLVEPRIVTQSSTDSEILGDGFRWRKYGQKVVKGNPYPRSYYRCTNTKCNVRKHVERAIDDPRAFVTTYEGKHNHEMPLKNTASVASEKDSQASLSKDKS